MWMVTDMKNHSHRIDVYFCCPINGMSKCSICWEKVGHSQYKIIINSLNTLEKFSEIVLTGSSLDQLPVLNYKSFKLAFYWDYKQYDT